MTLRTSEWLNALANSSCAIIARTRRVLAGSRNSRFAESISRRSPFAMHAFRKRRASMRVGLDGSIFMPRDAGGKWLPGCILPQIFLLEAFQFPKHLPQRRPARDIVVVLRRIER
jgi:hypothetical protein